MNQLLLKDPSEIMEMIKEEVKEIIEMPTIVLQPKFGFDEKEGVNLYDAFDLLEEFEEERLEDQFVREKSHTPIMLKFDKIHNYNKLHCNITHKTNDIYAKYSKDIMSQIPDEVIELLQSGNFKLDISFYIINRNQDLDNLDEAFNEMIVGNFKKAIIDSVFKKAKINDNKIKAIKSRIFKSFTDFEFVLLRVTRMSNYETEQDYLLSEFLHSGGVVK